MIKGLTLTKLKIIKTPKGDVLHGIKSSEKTFSGFGEAYFSTVNIGDVKGWKKHSSMILNLIVPKGSVRFVAYDDRVDSPTKGNFFEVILNSKNYQRLTVDPNIWLAFQGLAQENMLLNLASIEHDPDEATSLGLEEINYSWDIK
jgi:dTDP-4-dehydrorhamnose 3,5-epimerase